MKREAKERESGERMEERRGNGVAEAETVRSRRLELGLRIRVLRDLKTAMGGTLLRSSEVEDSELGFCRGLTRVTMRSLQRVIWRRGANP